MPQKSILDQFNMTDVNLQPLETLPDISDNIQQTLARLMAWNSDLLQWKRVTVDTLGRLVVATDSGTFTSFTTGKSTITTTSSAILNANTSRRNFIIFNLGPQTIYIKSGSAATTNDFPISAGQYFSIDSYTGSINAITASVTAEVRYIEA